MSTFGPVQVAAGNDDAHEKANSTSFSAFSIYTSIHASVSTSSRYNAGFRFTSVAIESGDTIDDVDFEMYSAGNGLDLHVDARANDVDDAVDFSTDADVTTRVNSAATVAKSAWIHDNVSKGFFSSATDGIDMNAVFQTLIDRGGWATGQDIVVLLEAHKDATYSFAARSYDYSSSYGAKLTVDFTTGGGGPPVLASRRLLSGVGR